MIALDELKKLPLEERIQIVDELTKSIEEDSDLRESPEFMEELRTRRAAYLADPSSAVPWEAALEQIRLER